MIKLQRICRSTFRARQSNLQMRICRRSPISTRWRKPTSSVLSRARMLLHWRDWRCPFWAQSHCGEHDHFAKYFTYWRYHQTAHCIRESIYASLECVASIQMPLSGTAGHPLCPSHLGQIELRSLQVIYIEMTVSTPSHTRSTGHPNYHLLMNVHIRGLPRYHWLLTAKEEEEK